MILIFAGNLSGGASGAGGPVTEAGLRPALATIIGDLITSGGALSTIAGGKVYFGASPQSAQLPAVNYHIQNRDYGHNLSGSNAVSTAEIHITIAALLESDTDAICQAFRDRLDGFSGTAGGLDILSCLLDTESDWPHPPKAGSTKWVYTIELVFTIKHRVSLPSNLGG